MNAVKIFNEKEVDELIFLDISAGDKGPSFDLLVQIASECFMPFTYGGGISTIEHIKKLIKLGVEKISLNSAAFTHPELISKAAEMLGSSSVVVSIDVKKNFWGKYTVVTHQGKKSIGLSPTEAALLAEKHGAGEIMLNSVDADGTREGYDLKLIRTVAETVSIPVIACGGAGSIQDLKNALEAKASAAAAGSLFVFRGKHRAVLINYPTASEISNLMNT